MPPDVLKGCRVTFVVAIEDLHAVALCIRLTDIECDTRNERSHRMPRFMNKRLGRVHDDSGQHLCFSWIDAERFICTGIAIAVTAFVRVRHRSPSNCEVEHSRPIRYEIVCRAAHDPELPSE